MNRYLLPIALLACAGLARAHVTLEQPEAPAASSYRAVLRVGHGCEGGSATRQLAVTPPPGLRRPRPMPKPGWTLEIRATGEIVWTAKTEADHLQDAWYDEFIIRTGLPAEPGDLTLQVRQVCVTGEAVWKTPLRVTAAR